MKYMCGRQNLKSELLSPAGSYNAARAAVNAGADAIYMGGPSFSARAYAESSSSDMLTGALDFCHLRGVKVYLTLNTLIKQKEFDRVAPYIEGYASHRLDGIIVQDLGVMRLVRENFPGINLHVSTQAAVTGPEYAGLLLKMGASRIILARELDLDEIACIYAGTGAEIEAFAHGALCYSYSGQCLMSSVIGGRSGNRGRCAGTCRLPFEVYDDHRRLNRKDGVYVLSMKDLSSVRHITDMLSAGVYSFKIEGRMKSPEYTAAVTSVYRRYLDISLSKKHAGEASYARDTLFLSETFDRGGITSGYLDAQVQDMVMINEKEHLRIRDEEVIEGIRKKYLDHDIRHPVKAHAELKKGRKARFIISSLMPLFQGMSAEVVSGPAAEQARSRPLLKEDVRSRLSKFGDTDFELKELTIDMDDDLFIPVKALNDIRRQAAGALRMKLLSGDAAVTG